MSTNCFSVFLVMVAKPLSIFYIEYQDGDPLSYLLAWTVPLPYFIVAMHFAILLFRRELWSAWTFAGYFANEVVNHVLKDIIKQPRPPGSYKPGNGMPSDHAQFMFNFFILFSLLVSVRCKFQNKLAAPFLQLCALGAALIVCYSRVYSGVHTISQVAAGAVVGSAFGFLWFFIGHLFVAPLLFPMIESLSLAKYFYVRDSTNVQNVLAVEYEACHKAATENNKNTKKNK